MHDITPGDEQGPSAFAVLLAVAVRDIERASPVLGRVARSAVAHYNAEMARINGREEPDHG